MSPPRFFTLDYVEHAVLRDGTKVRLRLIRPDDKELLRAGFERWSAQSRYTRFLAVKTSLTDDELRYLSEIDQESHFAVGAVGDDDPEVSPVGLGVARFIRIPDPPNTAEAAVAVADEAQNKGLGKLLLMRLIAAATERGIERFRCEVLSSNAAMTSLLTEICPDRSIEVSAGVASIVMELPTVSPTEPLAGAPLASPPYRLLRAAAANAVEWTDAVRRLWRR